MAATAYDYEHPATYAEWLGVTPVPLSPTDTPRGCQINIVATDSPPHVMQNVATYYRQKEEPWADAMARRLVPANDNRRRK